MTREEAIDMLYGMKADNLNLDDAYTKDKYDALEMAIQALEQEPSGDLISRQATIEAFQMFRGYEANRTNAEWVDRIETIVKKLPPVNPQPKIGHWIEKNTEDGCGELYSYWACSECGRSVGFNLANIEDVLSDYPYCHCGAKMIEQKESEGI